MAAFFYLTILFPVLLASCAAANYGGITVDLIHRDSPSSPFYDPTKTRFDLLRSAFDRSTARQSFLNHYKTTTASQKEEAAGNFESPIRSDGGEYLMKIGIGSPPLYFLAIADTGSDLTWTQCQPCTSCFQQRAPLFDPTSSSSYATLSCDSDLCPQLLSSSCTDQNVCEYQYKYADGSQTLGDLSSETLTIGGSAIPRVAFGCTHKSNGTFTTDGSGLIGLGGGPISIISQLSNSIGGKFSYCLTTSGSNGNSKISFGPGSDVAGPYAVSTPLVRKDPSTFYYVTMEGISIDTTRLDYYARSDGHRKYAVEEGNVIIDSGTTLTYLPSEFYSLVETALAQRVNEDRMEDLPGSFKLCYKKSPEFQAPSVVVHFSGGADVELTQESTFMEVEEGVMCLTLVPSDDLSVFGNLNQMNYRIGFDIGGAKVNFVKTDCANESD